MKSVYGLLLQAKAISREDNAIDKYEVLVVNLSEVPLWGVTSSLALKNAMKESIDKGHEVRWKY